MVFETACFGGEGAAVCLVPPAGKRYVYYFSAQSSGKDVTMIVVTASWGPMF